MAGIREVFEIVDRATAPLRNVENAMGGVVNQTVTLNITLNEYNNRQKEVEKSTRKTDTALKSLMGTFGKFLSVAAVLATLKKSLDLSDVLTLSQARLNGINDGLQTTAELQDMIYQSAQRARGSYTEMMNTVTSLKAQTGDTFASLEEAAAFTELLQKQFKIAGTDAAGISSTMYNLTQALSTGVLRGQDLNIVMSNAPQIAQRIADSMGITIGQLKEVASEGKVTADIVKNAMLGASDDINKQFEKMPKTFGDVFQQVKNVGVRAFEPIGTALSNAINSPAIQSAINALGSGLYFIGSVAGVVIQGIVSVFNFLATIFGVVFQTITGLATNVLHLGDIFVALSTVVGAVFNGIANIIMIVANIAITIWEQVYNVFLQITNQIARAFAAMGSKALSSFSAVAKGADSAATAIANAFIAGANAAIGGINKLIDALNAIPGVSISNVGTMSQVSGFGFADAIEAAQKGLDEIVNAPEVEHVSFDKFDTVGLIEGFANGASAGADWAKGVLDGMSNMGAAGNYGDLLGDIANNTANAVPNGSGGNVGKVGKVGKVDNVKLSDEDRKIYRDLAERRYMNQIELKTLAPEITVNLPAGASGNFTADDVADKIKKILIEQMAAQTAVAHA